MKKWGKKVVFMTDNEYYFRSFVSVHGKTILATDIRGVYTDFISVLCMIYKGFTRDL